jgi:hypothetical protein
MGTLMKRGLFVPVSILLVAGAYAAPAEAQIARPAGSQNSQPITPMAPTAPTAPSASTQSAAAPQQMLYYVCGNAGIEGRVNSPDPQHPFNLGITFVSSSNGAPLSDVAVKLRRHGRVLMEFVAAGPHCLFAVPDADYRIEGTWRGEMKFEIVQTGNLNAQIKW